MTPLVSLMDRAIARALSEGASSDRDCARIVQELISEEQETKR